MQITVKGFNKAKTQELEAACQFFAEQLLHAKTIKNLMIDIERNRKLDVVGECTDEDGTRNPRWFTITLRGAADDDDVVKTLAHEMVHVKQHAKNELQGGIMVATKGGLKMYSKWQGELWKPKGKEDHYWDSPWEIEAYGREVGLYHKWVEVYNSKKI